jgi:hypothetical protein
MVAWSTVLSMRALTFALRRSNMGCSAPTSTAVERVLVASPLVTAL